MIVSVGDIEKSAELKKILEEGKKYKVASDYGYCDHSETNISKGDTVKFVGTHAGYLRFTGLNFNRCFLSSGIEILIVKSQLRNKLKKFIRSSK